MAALSRQAADVRINEVDLSTAIAQNSNITAALVAVSAKGPIGPNRYTNFDAFKADFGNPNARVSFDHYSAQHFFKQGNSLWVTRAVASDADYGCLALYVDSVGVTHFTQAVVANPLSPDWSTLVPAGSTPLYLFFPYQGPGSYSANIALEVLSENLTAPTGVAVTSAATGGFIAPATLSYYVSAKSQSGETLASTPVTIIVTAVGNTSTVTVTWDAVPGAVSYCVYGRSTVSPGLIAEVGAQSTSFTDDGLTVVSTTRTPILSSGGLPTPSTKFILNVYDNSVNTSVPAEPFECSLDELVDESGLNSETAQRVNSFSSYVRVVSNTGALLSLPSLGSAAKMSLGTGDSGSTPTSADINASWDLFLDKERYVIDVLINSGKTAVAVQQHMDYVAKTRFDCVSFLDVPANLQKAQDAVDYRRITLNLNSSFSALFCSDIYVSDPINGKNLYIPPSGAMAGLMAYTSRVTQPWFSIAGLNRGLVDALDVRRTYGDSDATYLYQAQVNYMRKFLGRGIPLWEQSTLLNKASALQFLNVRVLCNVLKRSIYDFLIYSLQEPNDDLLRKQIVYGLSDYLSYVEGARGIRSFIVQCNDENNPPILVNSGALAVGIYIVPTLGLRQINLSLLVGKQGLEVTETDLAAFQ